MSDSKCDLCVYQHGEGASEGQPWPTVWCAMGKWDGLGIPTDSELENDPWEDCDKFQPITPPE
jgi:hypothetical protein